MSSVDDQAQLGGRKGVVLRAWQPKELLQTEQANNTIFLNAETITMSLIIPQFFKMNNRATPRDGHARTWPEDAS